MNLSIVIDAARALVLAVFLFAVVIAITSWAVRARRLSPFGAWARFARRAGDPLLKPLERRLVRSGQNPLDAPVWLVGVALVVGLVLLSAAGWLVGALYSAQNAAAAGPVGMLRLGVGAVFTVLMGAILVRVIGSWLGVGPYTRWMRPVYVLTDWLIRPIQKIVPALGPFDVSPMVAWLVLWVLEGVVMRLL